MEHFIARQRRSGLEFSADVDAGTADTSDGKEVIEVQVCYDRGGSTPFASTAVARGIWLYVRPKRVRTVDGMRCATRSLAVFGGNRRSSGVRVFVAPLSRRLDARLERVAAALDGEVPALARLWVADHAVATQRILELATYAAATLAAA